MSELRFSLEHRVFIYFSYVRTESARQVRRLFAEKFPTVKVPARETIRKLVCKFRETGNIIDKKRTMKKWVLTEEMLDDIDYRLKNSPRKSIRHLAQQAGISRSSAHRAMKLLKMKFHKTTYNAHAEKMMSVLTPKASGEFITKLAKNVFVIPDGITKLAQEVAEGIKKKEISVDGFSQCELHPQRADDSAVDWIFLIDTLNFCFWSPDKNNKWTVTFNGKPYTGYFALCAAVQRAIKEGKPITDPKFYSKITSQELVDILRSDNPDASVPLLEERVKSLHEVGTKLLEKYNGTFVTCLKECNKSAQNLLQIIVQDFPCFKDEATYQGHKVAIYKRAQILIGDIWACFKGKGLGQFNDIETITMFADYRVPQVLIHYGAMKYSEELMEKLRTDELLENGSEYEVEIRGVSIHIVELVANEVRKILKSEGLKNLPVNSIIIDHFLWDYRRRHAEMLESIPYHKTLSIYY